MRYSMKKIKVILCLLLLFTGATASAALHYEWNDLAVFRVKLPEGDVNEKSGYILIATGQWMIPPQFDGAQNFGNNSRALISVEKGRTGYSRNIEHGYIDLQGRKIIEPQYSNARSFSEGVASVELNRIDMRQQHLYIDQNGKVILHLSGLFISPSTLTAYDDFHDEMAGVTVRDNNGIYLEGFINKEGLLAIAPRFIGAKPFSDGVAVVQVIPANGSVAGGAINGKLEWGVINKSGNYVIPPRYSKLESFSEGLVVCQLERSSLWGYIDKSGEIKIMPRFTAAKSFRDGLAPVKEKEKWGYINPAGEFVLAPVFDDAMEFRQGIAKVAKNGKYGWIDKTGSWIVQPVFARDAVYLPKQHIVYVPLKGIPEDYGYFCNLQGQKLDHYVNHMVDGYQYLKTKDFKAAAASFTSALKINPKDRAADWGLRLAEDSLKE